MQDCFKKALGRVLSMQQYSQKYNMILFNYIFYKVKWIFFLCFLFALLDLSISFTLSIISIHPKIIYILAIFITFYLITTLYMLFAAIASIMFNNLYNKDMLRQFFFYNQLTLILYLIVKSIIIFVYIPDSSSDISKYFIDRIYLQLIWGIISVPFLIKAGLLPLLLKFILSYIKRISNFILISWILLSWSAAVLQN